MRLPECAACLDGRGMSLWGWGDVEDLSIASQVLRDRRGLSEPRGEEDVQLSTSAPEFLPSRGGPDGLRQRCAAGALGRSSSSSFEGGSRRPPEDCFARRTRSPRAGGWTEVGQLNCHSVAAAALTRILWSGQRPHKRKRDLNRRDQKRKLFSVYAFRCL